MVARLADGTWSAPSAIGTGGAGFGGQIGFEITDFVFITLCRIVAIVYNCRRRPVDEGDEDEV